MRKKILFGALLLAAGSYQAWGNQTGQLVNTALARNASLQDSKVDVTRFQRFSTSTHKKVQDTVVRPVFYNATTVTLPAAGEVHIFKGDTSARPVTIVPKAGATIMQDTSYQLTIQGESVRLKLIGSNWFKL